MEKVADIGVGVMELLEALGSRACGIEDENKLGRALGCDLDLAS